MGSMIDGQPAQGWYDDPTGRHELRWFSAGNPTALVRDAGRESQNALAAGEQGLRAVSGPGLMLPGRYEGGDGRGGPVAWWDSGVPEPGEPTIADIGISGYQGYDMIRQIRLIQRVGRSGSSWRTAVVTAVVLVVLFYIFL